MNTVTPICSPIEQLPLRLYEVISSLLFSSPSWPASKGEAMLTCLLRYATIQQLSLEEGGPYANIAIPNLLKIYRADRQWQQVCCYQTLHICIRLLCALGILKKQRISGQPTSYLLPLDPEYHFEATPILFAAVDRLCDPMCTKNPKVRKKACEVKRRLVRMNPALSQNQVCEKRPDFPPSLSMKQQVHRLVDSLSLSVSVANFLMQGLAEICADIVGREQASPVFVDSARVSLQQVVVEDSVASGIMKATTHRTFHHESPDKQVQEDSSAEKAREESPEMADVGDSFPLVPNKESPTHGLLGDSSATVDVPESPSENPFGDSLSAHSEHKGVSFEHKKQQESPTDTKNLHNVPPSSIDSSHKKDSFRKDLELEGSELWTGSDEELHREALHYLRLLDGPQYATAEYVQTHDGKKALGGYTNKIRRSPWFVRVSAINTLLQRTFYDLSRQKKPLDSPGKWFHASFDRYVDSERPMEITGEILDWAKSSYTLEEIAHVLPLERKRQEKQWQSPEPLHRPFSSCVHVHQHHEGSPQVPYRESEMSTFGMAPAHGMDHAEAEHLAQEIREHASWYLEQAHARREPTLGAYIVEATCVGFTLSKVYTCRENWWQEHLVLMQHREWERQFEEGAHCGTYSA